MNDCDTKVDYTRQLAALYDLEDFVDCKGEPMNTTGLEEEAVRTYASCIFWTHHKHVNNLVFVFGQKIVVKDFPPRKFVCFQCFRHCNAEYYLGFIKKNGRLSINTSDETL